MFAVRGREKHFIAPLILSNSDASVQKVARGNLEMGGNIELKVLLSYTQPFKRPYFDLKTILSFGSREEAVQVRSAPE